MIIFITTFIISFLGSVHPGPLNVSVVEITLTDSLKAGIIMALGGIIPELIYSFMAVEGVMLFQKNIVVFNYVKWAMVVFLILMGFLSIFKSPKTIKTKAIHSNIFIKGIVLSLFNPQLVLFWVFIVIYFHNIQYLAINTISDKIAFVLGTAAGAYCLNYTYAKWANAKKDLIFSHINLKLFNWLIGGSFLSMAAFQVYKLVNQ